MAQTPQEYFETEDLHGGYQYLSLKNLLDKLEAYSEDPDHYLVNTPRRLMRLHAKQGIKVFNREIKKTIRAFEVTIGSGLNFVLPQDYVNWVRVSVVDYSDGRKLKPLNINNNINIATGYLQDNDANILFDESGQILTADSNNTYNHTHTLYEFCHTPFGQQQELDTSKLSLHGEFKIDERRGKIVFSSNLEDAEIVMEYVSDGLAEEELSDEEITFHKDLEECLIKYVYMACISGRRNVDKTEKRLAKDDYKTELHKAKLVALDLDFNQIIRVSRTSTIQP